MSHARVGFANYVIITALSNTAHVPLLFLHVSNCLRWFGPSTPSRSVSGTCPSGYAWIYMPNNILQNAICLEIVYVWAIVSLLLPASRFNSLDNVIGALPQWLIYVFALHMHGYSNELYYWCTRCFILILVIWLCVWYMQSFIHCTSCVMHVNVYIYICRGCLPASMCPSVGRLFIRCIFDKIYYLTRLQ